MTVSNAEQIAEQVIGASGITDDNAIATAVAIALAESGGDDDRYGDIALEDAKWGPSYGLWQIRTLKKPGDNKYRDLNNLKGNSQFQVQAMSNISAVGTKWGDWTTYNTGAYLLFLPQAKAGVASARAGGAVDMTKTDPGAAVGENIPGDKGDTLGYLKNIAGEIGSIGEFIAKLTDPAFVERVVKVVGGGVLLIAGLVILNRDLLGGAVSAAADLTPAGRVAKVATNVAS